MNGQFNTMMQERLEALVSGLQYWSPADQDLRDVTVVQSMLPRPTAAVNPGDPTPLLRWSVYKGLLSDRAASSFAVLVEYGICVNESEGETIVDGTRQIQELFAAVGLLVRKRSFPPYRLRTPVPFFFGSQEEGYEGVQPHPYYLGWMILEFIIAGHEPDRS